MTDDEVLEYSFGEPESQLLASPPTISRDCSEYGRVENEDEGRREGFIVELSDEMEDCETRDRGGSRERSGWQEE